MRKVNFDNIENLEIPDYWVEKALSLKSEPKQKKSVFTFPAFYRNLAYVACFIAVCALTVALFSLVPRGDILPVKHPNVSVTQNNKTETSNNNETQSGISQTPTHTQSENVEETEDDTQNSTQNATSTAPTLKPTQPPEPSETETQPDDGSMDPNGQPSNPNVFPDGPGIIEGGVSVGFVPESALCGSSTVYCYIIPNRDGVMGGETGPTMYPANVTYVGDGNVIVSFEGYKSADALVSDYYNFYFLNVNGEIIFEETIYVTVK